MPRSFLSFLLGLIGVAIVRRMNTIRRERELTMNELIAQAPEIVADETRSLNHRVRAALVEGIEATEHEFEHVVQVAASRRRTDKQHG
jgi:hypothetical protein